MLWWIHGFFTAIRKTSRAGIGGAIVIRGLATRPGSFHAAPRARLGRAGEGTAWCADAQGGLVTTMVDLGGTAGNLASWAAQTAAEAACSASGSVGAVLAARDELRSFENAGSSREDDDLGSARADLTTETSEAMIVLKVPRSRTDNVSLSWVGPVHAFAFRGRGLERISSSTSQVPWSSVRSLHIEQIARARIKPPWRLLAVTDAVARVLPRRRITRIVRASGGCEAIAQRLVDATEAASPADRAAALVVEL